MRIATGRAALHRLVRNLLVVDESSLARLHLQLCAHGPLARPQLVVIHSAASDSVRRSRQAAPP
eukprot:11589070-Alexandrium_andersonii.AAC.1